MIYYEYVSNNIGAVNTIVLVIVYMYQTNQIYDCVVDHNQHKIDIIDRIGY